MRPEPYDIKQDDKAVDAVTELAQKLYNEDGYQGNLYKTPGNMTNVYEARAMAIIGEE